MKIIIALLFILTSSISFSQDHEDCPDIKTGFYGYAGELKSLFIYRTKEAQIEYDMNSEKWAIVKLDWVSNCEYIFTFHKTTMTQIDPFIGEKFNVRITSHDANGYKCNLTPLNNETLPIAGEILYKTKVSKKIQNKLKKILKKNT
jgi:hypothetical protein